MCSSPVCPLTATISNRHGFIHYQFLSRQSAQTEHSSNPIKYEPTNHTASNVNGEALLHSLPSEKVSYKRNFYSNIRNLMVCIIQDDQLYLTLN